MIVFRKDIPSTITKQLTLTRPLLLPDGTDSAPSLTFASDPDTGFRWVSSGTVQYRFNGAAGPRFNGTTIDGTLQAISFTAGGTLSNLTGGVGFTDNANGKSLGIKLLTELTTIAAAATTDTTIQMPANAIILGVSVRVTTVIPTAATFTVGDSGSAARFNTGASVSTAADTTNSGTKAGAYYNATALAIRITPNLTPADNSGRVRVTIHYLDITPPTS